MKDNQFLNIPISYIEKKILFLFIFLLPFDIMRSYVNLPLFVNLWKEFFIFTLFFLLFVLFCLRENLESLKSKEISFNIMPLIFLGMIYCSYILICGLRSSNFYLAVFEYRLYYQYWFALILVYFIISNLSDVKKILNLLVINSRVISIGAIIQLIFFRNSIVHQSRAALFSNPSVLSLYLASVWIYLIIEKLYLNERKYSSFDIIVISAELFILQTRTIWVGLALFVMYLVLTLDIKRKIKLISFILLLSILCSILLFPMWNALLKRITSISLKSHSMQIRIERWRSYFQKYGDNLLLGNGLGTVGVTTSRFDSIDTQLVENQFITWTLNIGVVGIVIVFGFFLYFLLLGYRLIKNYDGLKEVIGRSYIGIYILYFTSCLTLTTFYLFVPSILFSIFSSMLLYFNKLEVE
ncbi:O-antigen ligase family protein [Halanaerobaculum tunisiense]